MADCQENYIFKLPSEILEHIFTYFTYDTISQLRQVCKLFDHLSQQALNLGFSKVDKYHSKIQKLVKAKLPRRESERRNHPLAKHVNALSSVETRLSLMNMTYMKYIDMGLCCFIPGRVLDEMFTVLHALEDTCTQPRTHELLQELRDISSMAMEHFEEKIVPKIKQKISPVTMALTAPLPVASPAMTPGLGGSDGNEISWSTPPSPSVRQPAIRQEINTIRSTMKAASSSVLALKKEFSDGNRRASAQQKKLLEMEKKLQDQSKIINEQSKKITEHEGRIYRMRNSLFEYDIKFNTLCTEMNAIKSALGLKDTHTNLDESTLKDLIEEQNKSEQNQEKANIDEPSTSKCGTPYGTGLDFPCLTELSRRCRPGLITSRTQKRSESSDESASSNKRKPDSEEHCNVSKKLKK